MKRFKDFDFEEYDSPFRDIDTNALIRDLIVWNDDHEEQLLCKGDVIHLMRSTMALEILWLEKRDDYVRVNVVEVNVNWVIKDLIKEVKKIGYVLKPRSSIYCYEQHGLKMEIDEMTASKYSFKNYVNKDNFLEPLIDIIGEDKNIVLDILPFGDVFIRHNDGKIVIELVLWIGK